MNATEHKSKGVSGFSLMEILMVILIISILIGLVLGLSRYAELRANISNARSELGDLHHSLNEYYLVNNIYPAPGDSTSVTNIIPQISQWIDADTDGIDPWERPFSYIYDEEESPHSYHLYSCGPDRLEDLTDETMEENTDNVFFQKKN